MSDMTIRIDERDLPRDKDGEKEPLGDEFARLMDRAAKGDQSCLPGLRALFDSEAGPALVRAIGSPPAWLMSSLLDRAAGKHLAAREAIERSVAKVRADLEGPDPTPLERLLAERAAYCWLIVYHYEGAFARNNDMTIRQAEFHQNKIDRAHRRFLSAVKALAAVRKLALPALQINIGKNQVNVAGGEP